MTLSVAWVRDVGNAQELVIACDSRLRSQGAWDGVPKIIIPPRGDSALCFAGDTNGAYPLMLQYIYTITSHPKSLNRAMDLYDFKGHLVRVFNQAWEARHDLPKKDKDLGPGAVFLLGGYSWRKAKFVLWTLHFDKSIRGFTFRPAVAWKGGNARKMLSVTGDASPEFMDRLRDKLKEKDKLAASGFDMEPFEVLRDIIREGKYSSIGGAPQLVKVYKHLNVQAFGVHWPAFDGGSKHYMGRKLLDYERPNCSFIDPDRIRFEPDESDAAELT